MKKTLLFAILALGIFVSCKKSSSGSSSYHFTATIDGQAQTFNVSPLAVKVTNVGTLISIEGFSAASTSAQSLAIGWTNAAGSGITSATFGTGTFTDTSSNYATIGTYVASSTSQYISGTNITELASFSGVTIANHLKIVITAVDSNTVKGTFSGDFYYNGDLSGAKKTITNGDFYVPWKH